MLNENSRYKILTNEEVSKYLKYKELISKVKDAQCPNSSTLSEHSNQPRIKRIKYTRNIDGIQYNTPSSTRCSRILGNSLTRSSKSTFNEISSGYELRNASVALKSLADIETEGAYQIIVHVSIIIINN